MTAEEVIAHADEIIPGMEDGKYYDVEDPVQIRTVEL